MPQLVDGKWETGDVAASEMKNGVFHREPTSFRNWITPNGEPGPDGQPSLPAEAGRYQLFVAFICPWASRTLMMRNLKGLQDIVSVSISQPELGEKRLDVCTAAGCRSARRQDPLPARTLYRIRPALHWQGLRASALGPQGRPHRQQRVRRYHPHPQFGFQSSDRRYLGLLSAKPAPGTSTAGTRRSTSGSITGVYRAGFAKTQGAYEDAVTSLFDMLDTLEAHLSVNRYIAGTHFTEADIRLFVTLIRFDAAYHGAFKCNLRAAGGLSEPVELSARNLPVAGYSRNSADRPYQAGLLFHRPYQPGPDRAARSGAGSRSPA
jgi:putative glutathione S-transferase